jgi:alkylhydroperoxidase/carboxymuconolactone decarboxylase family protein YurZ
MLATVLNGPGDIRCEQVAEPNGSRRCHRANRSADRQPVPPALERYATDKLANGLWKRPGLAPRDRSIVTVAAVITRNQGILLPEQVNLALDNGVKPAEISEIITHLAFYAGWGNARAATAITKDVFEARGIGADQLPKAAVDFLPLDEKAEADRAARVEQGTGPASLGLVRDTTDVLFRDRADAHGGFGGHQPSRLLRRMAERRFGGSRRARGLRETVS